MSIHREKKQRPEFEGPVMLHAEFSQYLFPEPWGWILSTSFKPRLETHCSSTTSSTPAFLLHCLKDSSTPDSLYSLYNSLTAWSENREWENGNSWTSGSQSVILGPAAAASPGSLLERQILGPSHPDLLNQKLERGANYLNQLCKQISRWSWGLRTTDSNFCIGWKTLTLDNKHLYKLSI